MPQIWDVDVDLGFPATDIYSFDRVSTDQQAGGRGMKRQGSMAEQWCQRHGLTLRDERRLSDPGKSAFHGKHLRSGSPLSKFMDMAERQLLGEHPVLLVEEVDRLTRLAPLDALESVVLRLIQNGVTLVTLSDDSFYNRESMNNGLVDLMKLVLYVQAAHDYSRKLSRRQEDNWVGVREKLKQGIVARKNQSSPSWLDWDDQSNSWKVNKKADTVIRAMHLLKSHGYAQVAKKLNDEGYPPLTSRSKNGWNPGSLSSMVRASHFIYGAAVMRKPGAWKPMKRDKNGLAVDPRFGKGVMRGSDNHPGEIVRNVFPALLSEEEVNDVLYCIKGRHRTQSHLGPFSKMHYIGRSITTCACCSGVMTTCVGGHPPHRLVRYVACRNRLGADCRAPYMPMRDLVAIVLSRMTAAQLGSLSGASDQTEKTIQLKKKLNDASAVDEKLVREIAQCNENLKEASISLKSEMFATVAATLGEQIEELQQDRESVLHSISGLRSDLARTANPLSSSVLIDIISPLKNALINGTASMEQRAQANAAMKQLGLQIHVNTVKQEVGLSINDGEIDWQPIDMRAVEDALNDQGIAMSYQRFEDVSVVVYDAADSSSAPG